MLTVLVTITVLLGLAGCDHFDPVADFIENIPESGPLESQIEEISKYTQTDGFKVFTDIMPVYGILADSFVNLSEDDPCNPVSMGSLRQIVEIALGYDKKAFSKKKNLRLSIIVDKIIDLALDGDRCIKAYTKHWEANASANIEKIDQRLNWIDSFICPFFKCEGRKMLGSALKRVKEWNKHQDPGNVLAEFETLSLMRNKHVKETMREAKYTINKEGNKGRQLMEIVYSEHIREPCKQLTESDWFQKNLKPTKDLNVLLKLTGRRIDFKQESLDLYKWTSRYTICQLLLLMKKDSMINKTLPQMVAHSRS